MRVAIIGGSGFVGSSLAKKLTDTDVTFQIFDLNKSSPVGASVEYVDVQDPHSLKVLAGSDVIVNLAAVHRDDVRPVSRYDEVNVDGARNVCAAASELGIDRIIFTSTVAVYGFAGPDTGEDGAIEYFNDYGRTKYLAEKVYQEWQSQDQHNRSLVIVRPTVIFGPGNRGNVYNLLRQIASKRFAMFGNGLNVKSMAYVENVADFIAYTATLDSSGVTIFNYIDKPDLTMNDLVSVARKTLFGVGNIGVRLPGTLGLLIGKGFDFIAWIIGKPLPISSIRVKKFMATTQFSSAAAETGFRARYTLAEGLQKTLRYEFLEDNRDKPTYDTE